MLSLAVMLAVVMTLPVAPQDGESSESLAAAVAARAGERAFALYIGGIKAGWMTERLEVADRGGQRVAVLTLEMLTRMAADDAVNEDHERIEVVYELEGRGSILEVRARMVEDGAESTLHVVRRGDGMEVARTSDQGMTRRETSLPKENLREFLRCTDWLAGDREPGDQIEYHDLGSTDWTLEEIDVSARMTFLGREAHLLGGSPVDLVAVQVESEGMVQTGLVDESGSEVSMRIGGFAEIRREPVEWARDLDGALVDLMAVSSIPVECELDDFDLIESLDIRVEYSSDFQLPISRRQEVFEDDGGLIWRITRDHRVEAPSPLTDAEREGHLRSSPTLLSEHPEILELARKILGPTTDPMEKIERLQRWLFQTLHPTYEANASTALDVLGNGAGDCSEFALLFVSLARAAGVPARQVSGLVYAQAENPLFCWHAWAEAHDGRGWITVDPSHGQVFVDATHIKLGEGVRNYSWINLMGDLRFEVVAVR